MITLESRMTEEKYATEHAFSILMRFRGLDAVLGPWEQNTTADGINLSAQVTGPQARKATHDFASTVWAQMDVSATDRVGVVWESNGVWLELWYAADTPDTPARTPAAPAEPATKSKGRPVIRPRRVADRLPTTRKGSGPA